MKDKFNLRKFLTENKLTSNSRLLKEEYTDYEPGTIAPEDLYYSDKHGKLVALDDVDDEYHDGLELVYDKGDRIEDPMDEAIGDAVIWNWDGDRNTLEEVPPKFKLAVKAKVPKLNDRKFAAAFDAVKNSFADDAGRGSMKFNSNQWADIIKDDTSKKRGSGLHPDYDKGGKYYSEEGAEAFRIQPFKKNDIEYTKDQAIRQGKYIVGLEGEELEKFISAYMAAWEADKEGTEPGSVFKENKIKEVRIDREVAERIEGMLNIPMKHKFLDAFDDLWDDLTQDDMFYPEDVINHLSNELHKRLSLYRTPDTNPDSE